MKTYIEIIENVSKTICDISCVELSDILSKKKNLSINTTRGMLWYILHYDYNISISKLTLFFNRTPRNIKRQIAQYRFFINNYDDYKELYSKLNNKKKVV